MAPVGGANVGCATIEISGRSSPTCRRSLLKMSSNRVCRSCARLLPRIGSRIRWNSGCLATERVESSNGLRTCETNASVNHVRCILGSSLLKRASSKCVQLTLGHAGMRRNPFRNFHSTTDEGASSDGDTVVTAPTTDEGASSDGDAVVTEPTPHQSPQTKCMHITSQPQEPLTAEERAAVHSEPMNRSGHSSPQVAQTESETADIGLQSSSEKTVGGYTYDELLERIAKAQLQRNERVVDTQEKLEKKREKLLRKTVMNIDELIDFLREERAHDICVIKVPPEREYVDYFVVCGGLGTRHIRTMADNLVTEVSGLEREAEK